MPTDRHTAIDPTSILSLQGYGAAFGEKVILSELNLNIYDKAATVLLGPSGTGKSTLLRSLAGLNDANPFFRTWGEAIFAGDPVAGQHRPALVTQSAQLMMSTVLENIIQQLPERNNLTQSQQRDLAVRLLESIGLHYLADKLDSPVVELTLAQQRHIAILRLASAGPRLLCLDEPTTGLADSEIEKLLDHIAQEATRRGVLIVLHNQLQAKRLDGYVALLAGGVIQEAATAQHFFTAPEAPASQQFVRTGSCCVPSPGANADELDEAVTPPKPLPVAATEYVSESFGPRGFLWLLKGKLAGTPLPGVVVDEDYDLRALERVGITHLVSLMEFTVKAEQLQRYGMTCAHFSMPDMGVPSVDGAKALCQHIAKRIDDGDVVAVHCRAGLGRTGTTLALFLIAQGATAMAALERVRTIEPRWVQSDQQIEFLTTFSKALEQDSDSNRGHLTHNSQGLADGWPNAI